MAESRRESLLFYKYLCNKIGTKVDVRTRRLSFIICDMHNHPYKRSMLKLFPQISSGSKAEGLDLSGSDVDIMLIDNRFEVYESERKVVQGRKVVLIMDTEDTPHCFSKLRLLTDYNCAYDISGRFKRFLHFEGSKCLLSSELYKMHNLNIIRQDAPKFDTIHGPCISDPNERYDFAHCLKCAKWISQAQPWIHRPRVAWPNAYSIEKIIKCGVLFVPIGSKGSSIENLQWRISFSVAEKILIFSFNHTQLLCYALLKIFLKEIIDKHEDLKGLICSYFLKTLMFWISEEYHSSFWTPCKIIFCYKTCLRRLLYCIKYSTLLHFFIPDNNLLYLRLNEQKKATLMKLIRDAYNQDIKCFASSKTLNDYQNYITGKCNRFVSIEGEILKIFSNGQALLNHGNVFCLLKSFLYHSRSSLSRDIFTLFLSHANSRESQRSRIHSKHNVLQYFTHRRIISQLLISVHSDAASGWLMLATFFYNHKKYMESILIIDYILSKCTDEKIEAPKGVWLGFNRNQQLMLKSIKHENLITVLKAFTIQEVRFCDNSQILPIELQPVLMPDINLCIHPKPFAQILRFLCFYHLHDLTPCRHIVYQLNQIVKDNKLFQYCRVGNTLQLNYSQESRHFSFFDMCYIVLN
ncbi:uncharacterized protein LOC143070586 [Mytilus galloprovincialis]|uniref:uncharacterized protein LOC143070586 n=1 Tax=Mytilus galloprovincialis TaxID=29158 RepID=UPI003F7C8288